MMMIMITRVLYLESYRLVCLTLTCHTPPSSPLAVLYPSLYKLEGRVTCGVLVGLGLLYYKWNPSLASFVTEYSLYLKPAHHNMSRPSMSRLLGHRVLSLL